MNKPVIAVVGHVEHVTLGSTPALPAPGEIVHLEDAVSIAGGGGGVTFFQLTQSPAKLHLFSAVGNDAAGAEVERWLAQTNANLHLAHRKAIHTRDTVLVLPNGERTIVVQGWPLHPTAQDALPYDVLEHCDAVYFTAQDPELLKLCRRAKCLVVSARRRAALVQSGVAADVVVGSWVDAKEKSSLSDYPVPPAALVMTDGKNGGHIEDAHGTRRFNAPASPKNTVSTYGAGDSFLGALVWFLTQGNTLADACERAGPYGAAVLASKNTLAAQLPLRP